MSKYSELADALVITYPNAGATTPDVVTLARASAALREMEEEIEKLTAFNEWSDSEIHRMTNKATALKAERDNLQKDCEEACEDRAMMYAKNARLREAVLRLLTHRPEHPQAAYEQDEAFALAAIEDHLPETKEDEKD